MTTDSDSSAVAMDGIEAVNEVETSRSRSSVFGDRVFAWSTKGNAILVLVVLAAIMISLLIGSMPILRHEGVAFFVNAVWNPVTGHFGALVPVVDTLITAAIAMLLGIPVSFGIALFLNEVAPRWMAVPVGTAIEMLAAIPSIIFGMWGLFVFAPLYGSTVEEFLKSVFGDIPVIGALFQGPSMGIGISTAGIILAIMIVPFVASMMRDVFRSVPTVLKESAYGLGCTRWEVIRHVVLPFSRTGVVGAVMLGLGRALGETMAVTFVIGNSHQFTKSLFMPGATISSAIANEFVEADTPLHSSALVALGLTLFIITFVVLAFARYLLLRADRRAAH